MTRRADTGRTICKIQFVFHSQHIPNRVAFRTHFLDPIVPAVGEFWLAHAPVLQFHMFLVMLLFISHNSIKIPTYPGLVEDHEELVAEGLVDRVRLPLLVAEEGPQQVGKLVYVDGAVAGETELLLRTFPFPYKTNCVINC